MKDNIDNNIKFSEIFAQVLEYELAIGNVSASLQNMKPLIATRILKLKEKRRKNKTNKNKDQ